MANPCIFISGVAGFLGSHLAERALSKNYRVIGVDNLSLGNKENVPEGVEFYEYDLLDLEKNKRYTKNVDIVFHAAAYPFDNLSLFSPYQVTQNTFTITSSLLSGSIHNQVKRFIFCSSMARYGQQKSPFTEEMKPQPNTPYGIAKVAGENLVKNLAETHGFEYVICVPHNIFGPRQIYNDPYRNAVSIIINQMLQDLPPFIYGDGEQRRSFSPIQDVVKIFEDLLFSKKIQGETINIGPDERYITLNDLVSLLNEIMGKNIKPRYVQMRLQEVKEAHCSSEKAKRLLNYQVSTKLETALKEMVLWIKKQGVKKFSYNNKIEITNSKFPEVWNKKLY